MSRSPAVLCQLTKRYGAATVLRDATLSVAAGTVHALVGENGAGKTTLVKIIAGVVSADSGTLEVGGTAVAIAKWNRAAARTARIGIVHQHGASAGALTVVENAVLGVEPRQRGLLDLTTTANALAALGRDIGLAVDPHARVDQLALGAAQRAEIVAALHHGADLLILDEPTAVLAPPEVDGLLATIRELARTGKTIVLVTHKLDEVERVADAVTVLRAGVTVARFDGEHLEPTAIAREVVGGRTVVAATRPIRSGRQDDSGLEVSELAAGDGLRGVSFRIARGELMGIAGVDGNGQRELARAIAGLVASSGRVRIGGIDVSGKTPAERLANGLAHIPEDRNDGGVVGALPVADNLALARRDITGRWLIARDAVARHAVAQIAALDIRPPDATAIASTLSGGNQQKLVIGRELSRPRVHAVVASQPTRGVDLGAVAKIHERLVAAAEAGAAVLMISADLDELLALCHRVAVLLRGRIVGTLDDPTAADARARVGALMTGAQP